MKIEDDLNNAEGNITLYKNELELAIEKIVSNQNGIHQDFYHTINTKEEFGISRFISDRTYHLPELLSETNLIHQEGTTTYIVQAETSDSKGNSIKLEHRLQASSDEEATKIAKLVIKRLQGVEHKIWMATWQLANQLGRLTYTCELTMLMHLCNPNRVSYCSTSEKIEFYEHLRSLENTKLVYTKKTESAKKCEYVSHEIRLLEINTKVGEKEEYPREITLTILNPSAFQNEKTLFVGTGIKNRTLSLHADDVMLATVIQTRKSQRPSHKTQKWDRNDLIKVSGLETTSTKNKTHANKLLILKLLRLKENGILKDSPKKIGDTIVLIVN